MRETTPYRYRALRDGYIRVLTVLPGKFGDAIWVRLQQFDLAAHTKSLDRAVDPFHARYEALSYAWGSPNRTHSLEFADGSYVEVTQSLYHALQYLRYPGRERRIWADAVCINQDDLTERASQVADMANVFRHATCVLVWLGESTTDDTLAFATLQASDNWLEDELISTNGEHIEAGLKREPWCPCCKTPLAEAKIDTSLAYAVVNDLCDREWFSRLWVYQEVACARAVEVHCGFHHCSWVSFDRFPDLEYQSTKPSDIEIVSMCRIPTPGCFDPSVLLRLLVVLGEKDCREEQDRVFAIRSIAGLEHVEALEPDYTLSVDEVCLRVAVECLRGDDFDHLHPDRFTRHLNQNGTAGLPLPHISLLLALASSHSTEDGEDLLEGRPSWVPAFHYLSKRDFAKYYEYSWHLGPAYLYGKEQAQGLGWEEKSKAPAPERMRVEYLPEQSNTLRVLGYRFGTVLDVFKRSESPFAYKFDKGDFDEDDEQKSVVGPAFQTWISRCKNFLRNYGYDRLNIKDFKELMYCNSLLAGFDPDIYKAMMEDAPALEEGERADNWLLREFLEPQPLDPDKKLRYYDDFRNLAAITSTDGGIHFGWIPQPAHEGDVVSIFYACPRPFVLRQRADDNFTLLGDSWIFGVADDVSYHLPPSDMEWVSLR